MTSKNNLRKGRKLNYPSPFCGGDLFSALCSGVTVKDATANKHCLVLSNSRHSCHHFCLFVCNKRNIVIDGFPINDPLKQASDNDCDFVNKNYDDRFKSFPLLLKNKGFKI